MEISKYLFTQIKIKATIQQLSKLPEIGHFRGDIPLHYLSIPVGEHIIIYRINKPENIIQILRVLHSKMNFTQHL